MKIIGLGTVGGMINQRARRKAIGAAAIGIALTCSGLNISHNGPDSHADAGWRVSLVYAAYAEDDLVTALTRALEGAASSATTNSDQPYQVSSVGHLGMYVPADSASVGFGVLGGAFSITGSGYLEQDRSFPGVTKSPSYNDTLSYGGMYGVYDASRFVPANQSLTFFGTVGAGQNNLTFGPGPLPAESVSAGTNKIDFDILAGSVRWGIDSLYVKGFGMAIFGNYSSLSNFDAGGFGTSTARAYVVDATLGNIFVLYNTSGLTPSTALPTKAPSQATNGYMLGLDLSGHVGYTDFLINGYTDSVGLTLGDFEGNFPMLGATAKLFATFSGDKFKWTPYVSGAVDYYPGISFTLTTPPQLLAPTGDVQTFLPAPTFWIGELGLDAQNSAGWSVGVKGYYMASSDTTIRYAGGYLKIPLDFGSLASPRY